RNAGLCAEDRGPLLRPPLEGAAPAAHGDRARTVPPRCLAACGSAEQTRERAAPGGPAATAPPSPLHPVRGARRSGDLAPLAAGEDDASVGAAGGAGGRRNPFRGCAPA